MTMTALRCAQAVLPTRQDATCIFPESVQVQVVEVEENDEKLSLSLIELAKTRYKRALCHAMY